MSSYCLAVDLGTTFCAGAIATRGLGDADPVVRILEVAGERSVPSTVAADDAGDLLAGTVADRSVGRAPDRAERNPKRMIGRAPMLLGGVPVAAVDALAALLALFAAEARRQQNDEAPDLVVLTHPVAWTDAQLAALHEVAAIALPGVLVELLPEPVAAAEAFRRAGDVSPGKRIVVYDLGGGTFDAAVLSIERDGAHVLGRAVGDVEIGGEAFDHAVCSHFGSQLARTAPAWWSRVRDGETRADRIALLALLAEARAAKESLSAHGNASQYVLGADIDVDVTRTEFEKMISQDLERTAVLLVETVTSAGSAQDIDAVFLTGGASRTPLVRAVVETTLDCEVRTWRDPKTIVAEGAAGWGAIASTKSASGVCFDDASRAAPAQTVPPPAEETRPQPGAGTPPRRSRLGRVAFIVGAVLALVLVVSFAAAALLKTSVPAPSAFTAYQVFGTSSGNGACRVMGVPEPRSNVIDGVSCNAGSLTRYFYRYSGTPDEYLTARGDETQSQVDHASCSDLVRVTYPGTAGESVRSVLRIYREVPFVAQTVSTSMSFEQLEAAQTFYDSSTANLSC